MVKCERRVMSYNILAYLYAAVFILKMLCTFCTFFGSCESGYVGSICFWDPDPSLFVPILSSSSKKSKKNLDFYCDLFMIFEDFFFLRTGWGNGEMWTQSDVIQHPGRPLRGSFYNEYASYILHIFRQLWIRKRRIRMFWDPDPSLFVRIPPSSSKKSKKILYFYWLGKWWNVNTEWCRTTSWQTSTPIATSPGRTSSPSARPSP